MEEQKQQENEQLKAEEKQGVMGSDEIHHSPAQEESKGEEAASAEQKDIEENKLVAVLSYIGILFLIPMFAKKESKFSQFHAKQGLVLFLLEVLALVLMPLFGLGILLNLAAFILSVIGVINVLGGKMVKIPLIGDWADKFNL